LANPILFTSREFDAETGLYYNRARYLDPTTGRWTTQDPLGFAAGDANLYRYVGNTPTLLVDPSGNLAWFVAVPLVMSVGGFTWLTGSTALVSYRTTGRWWDAGTWGACWDGQRLGIQANVNGLASAARSLLTLGVWNEPWEVWAVDEVDRPYYNDAFLAARFGWELLPTAGIARLTQIPGQIGRWGRWALGWDAGQNAVQASRGGYDIYENGLTWTNGLQVVGSLLGLGGNYTTWRRLPLRGAPTRPPTTAPSTPTTRAAAVDEAARGVASARQSLINELAQQGIKHTPENIVVIGRDASGRIVFLERGTANAGLQHIVERHAADFAARGIPETQIPEAVIKAATEGRAVGTVGSGRNVRTVYEIEFNGRTQRIAVGVASNGFIVTAHPAN
jgi:RHS repeat-associated protein